MAGGVRKMGKGEKAPESFKLPLRGLLWHNGIYKTTQQDKIIDAMFFMGYRKLSTSIKAVTQS